MVSSSWARAAFCVASSSAFVQDAAESSTLLQRTKLKAGMASDGASDMITSGSEEASAFMASGTTASELRLLESLATAAVRNGDKIDDDTKAELRKLLEDELAKSKKQILEAHAADKAEGESMLASFNEHCLATFTSSQSVRKGHLEGQTEDLHNSHVALRGDLADADADQTKKCTALKNFNNMLRQDAPLEIPNERDAMKAWWAGLKEFLDGYRPQWQVKEDSCAAAEEHRETTLGQANDKQTSFENDFCAQKSGLSSSCEAYEECYAQSQADIGAVNANGAAGEASRKVEWEAIAKIECFARLLLGDTPADEAGLAACKNLDSSEDLAKLVLDDVVQPAQETCFEVDSYPCTADFVATRYNGLMDVQPCERCAGTVDLSKPLTIGSVAAMKAAGWTASGCEWNGGSSGLLFEYNEQANHDVTFYCNMAAELVAKVPMQGVSGQCTATFVNTMHSADSRNVVQLYHNGVKIAEATQENIPKSVTFAFSDGDTLEFKEPWSIIGLKKDWLKCV